MQKKLLIAGSALGGLLVAAVLGVGLFVDANQFRPQLEEAMGAALGRKVLIGKIDIALLSGGVTLQDLSIADDPAFSTAPFVTAKAVTVGVDLIPLIFSRSLHVESFRLEEPQVVLLNSSSGQWNFSSLAGAASETPSADTGTSPMSVVVQKLEIAKGRILVGSSGVHGKERVYDNVNLEASNLSPTSQFPFRLTATTPGGGTVTLDGQAGPLDGKDTANSPFQATAEIVHLDVASTGFIDKSSGLAGVIDFKGSVASESGRMSSKGKLTAAGVQLVASGAPAQVPVEIDYESDYSRKGQTGVIKKGDVRVGKALAHLTGDYDVRKAAAVRLTLKGHEMAASDLEASLPAIGMALPAGANLTQGALDINLTISGPIERLVIAGPINLSNASIGGYDLSGKLGALPSFGGAPKAAGKGTTLIETLAATLRIAPDGIRVENLNLVAPGLATLTGSGTIAPKGDLDFKILAKLMGGVSVGQISRITPANGIPIRIQGTTANPVFVPDAGQAARDAVGDLVRNPESGKKAADAVAGFFGRKKQ